MFSSRVFAALAVLVTVAAFPSTNSPVPQPITTIYNEDIENPWFTFPLFGKLFAPIWKLFPTFAEIGPRIISKDDKFQIIVNVKDYKKDDLKVKVKRDFIFIQGSQEAKQDDRDVYASQFFHTYTLPANASAADVTAELTSDGYLVVTALVGSGPAENNDTVDREVPITETGKPLPKEDTEEKSEVTTELANSEEDDRKEPTTASPKEEVTDKDNVIPHGNEPQL